jgi:hypothetical protein
MAGSISVQIDKKYGCQQVFVLRIQTEIINSVSDLKNSSSFCLTISTFVNSILGYGVCMSPRS